MVCLMVYLCGGIMEKHPDLKIICLETGASQMPWWLSRMDEHFEKLPHLGAVAETQADATSSTKAFTSAASPSKTACSSGPSSI